MKLLTVTEVAAVLRVTDDYVQKLCASGQLRARKVGKEWRIREVSLEAFVDETEKTEPTRPGRERNLTKKQRDAVAQRQARIA